MPRRTGSSSQERDRRARAGRRLAQAITARRRLGDERPNETSRPEGDDRQPPDRPVGGKEDER